MILHLDHLVLTVADINRTLDFYTNFLGMEAIEFGDARKALKFGNQKINLHEAGNEFEPKAANPTPGSADLCFITDKALPKWIQHFEKCGIEIVEGPVQRTGATGPINSVYICDPDGNLIEIGEPVS